ncbi:isopentenyl-diphosphate Delta-isomerase [Candidatus Peregrinibacteria bacterium]|nr:isopentenyl-diphosphate Delta-isomerase [Candidatus Peregrinibacteria bacterium]
MPDVILTDRQGRAVGSAEIKDAHTGSGKLHKAFSIYVFRKNKREILIQRRSTAKMLWPGIWANTCCSHPRKDESPLAAGTRRLTEELGFTTDLHEGGTFVYRAEDGKRGVEHEHVTILIGNTDDAVAEANPDEVVEWKWIDLPSLQTDMKKNPDQYAPWFHLGLAQILSAAHV